MEEERLHQILKEKETNRAAYEKDGWKYFDEAIPVIEDYHAIRKANSIAVVPIPHEHLPEVKADAVAEKVTFTPAHEKRIESVFVGKEVNRRIKNLRKKDKNAAARARAKR